MIGRDPINYTNSNYSCSVELEEDCFISKYDQKNVYRQHERKGISLIGNVYKYEFLTWEEVDIQIDNTQSNLALSDWMCVTFSFYYYWPKLKINKCTTEYLFTISDAPQIINFYEQRNKERSIFKNKILSLATPILKDISKNLVVLSDDLLLDKRILDYLHKKYYCGLETIAGRACESTSSLKGKEKKTAEQRNVVLKENIGKIDSLFSNFIELIHNEVSLKPYIERTMAWELVQASAIEYYAEIWENEFELELDSTYADIESQETKNIGVSLSSKQREKIQRKYIKQVLLCSEIDFDSVRFIFFYFLAKVNNVNSSTCLFEVFDGYDLLVKSVRKEINAAEIKKLLTTTQKRRIIKYTIDEIDLMNGSEFEEFVALLFKKMGYSSKVTKNSGDQGLDVIAAKNLVKIGVQVKCYSNSVGNTAVQEAVAGKSYYGCDKVMVITNNYFTNSAIELAKSNGVVLWDRDILKEKLKELF